MLETSPILKYMYMCVHLTKYATHIIQSSHQICYLSSNTVTSDSFKTIHKEFNDETDIHLTEENYTTYD